jgi:predicted nucleotidyltransferase
MSVKKLLVIVDPSLDELVRLLQGYDPDRIILFGSRARGDADEYSDYDLVVIKRTVAPFVDRLAEMAPYLAQFEHAAEILVYTPEEFDAMAEIGFGWVIHQEGVVIYERP